LGIERETISASPTRKSVRLMCTLDAPNSSSKRAIERKLTLLWTIPVHTLLAGDKRMLTFAGFFGRSANVAPHVNEFLSAHDGERLVHVAYVRPDGRSGSFCVPPARAPDLLPQTQCVLVSRAPVADGLWDAPPVFAALEIAPQQAERSHYSVEGPLLARLASVLLQRGLSTEAALSHTLDKCPAAMSTLFLVMPNGIPTLVATRRGPPIWLRQSGEQFAIFAGSCPPTTASNVRQVQHGDTIVIDRQRLSVIDIDGMRMEKPSSHASPVREPIAMAPAHP